MARDEPTPIRLKSPDALARPHISLVGDIESDSVERFLDGLREAEKKGGDVVLEVTTEGGDPEMARRIVFEVQAARARLPGRFLFLGKSVVYSAGITIMSAFPCRDRWLARDTMLMIHGRKLDKTVEIAGPIRTSVAMIEALRSQMQTALELEEKGFRRLIEGCDIGLDEIMQKALHNWYLTAEEALERGLISGIYGPDETVASGNGPGPSRGH